MVAILTGVVALHQWLAWWYQKPVHPAYMTIVALLALGIAVHRIRKGEQKAESLRLGKRGEIAVGQLLDELRSTGYRVFHDIEEDRYNIDHVVIGPAGIFVIETKTFSKPAEGRATVTYDGEKVLVNGSEPDRDPVIQAKACADGVRDILFQSTGRMAKIRPVVLFPGWWVEEGPSGAFVWVLNDRRLVARLNHQSPTLKREEISLFCHALETHIRASMGVQA